MNKKIINNKLSTGSIAGNKISADNKVPINNASNSNDMMIHSKTPTDDKNMTVNEPAPYNNIINEAISHNVITGESIRPYIRQAMYYETDQMAIIHHSNYIRWFEESRIDYLEQIGLGYDQLEADGILIPVLGVSCEYKSSVRFNDKVMILAKIRSFNGVKMTIQYKVLDTDTNAVKATGESQHCFVNKDFKPINMKKHYKEVYDILISWMN